MIKILHAADLHLDSPLSDAPELRSHLRSLPGKLLDICRREACDLVLLAGDLFDGPWTRETLEELTGALEEMGVPVFIAPGNHDFCDSRSPYLTQSWPENVHIFTDSTITGLDLPALDAVVYGAGFRDMDCPSLLEGFRADSPARHAIGLIHGDPTQANSPYNPITAAQVRDSGLDYLALGHIHKTGDFWAGKTLCAWPGCPQGRGFDELGPKGVLIVTLGDAAESRFVTLDGPQFHDLQVDVGEDPAAAVAALLPAAGNRGYYRITLTGESAGLDIPALTAQFSQFPHLELRDKTTAPVDLWEHAGEDSLEGAFFGLLRQELEGADDTYRHRVLLAAKLARKILDGQEVVLP